MRKIFVLLIGIVLLGCGGGGKTILPSTDPTDAFRVGNTQWGLELSDTWQRMPSPEGFSTVFLAQQESQNFIVLQEQGATENLPTDIMAKAQEDFLEFEALDIDEEINTFRFRGKTTLDNPVREFIQKVFVIPETNAFLLGSCSWEPSINSSVDCQNIIDSWQILVNKETPEK
jgi:hypothetical protein